MPIGVWGAGPTAAVFDNKIFVPGGGSSGRVSDTVQVYDGDIWTISPQKLRKPSVLGAAISYKGNVYLTGGMDADLVPTSSVQKFASRGWSFSTRMILPRRQHAAVIFRDELFVLGGDVSASDSDGDTRVEAFDGASWKEKPSMQVPRRDFPAVVWRDRLYAIGGQVHSSVESFDGVTWRYEEPMNYPRQGHTALIVGNDRIYLFGGIANFHSSHPSAISQVLEIGTVDSDGKLTWSLSQEITSLWKSPKYSMASCIFDDEYWVIGGADSFGEDHPTLKSTHASTQAWVFDPLPKRKAKLFLH